MATRERVPCESCGRDLLEVGEWVNVSTDFETTVVECWYCDHENRFDGGIE